MLSRIMMAFPRLLPTLSRNSFISLVKAVEGREGREITIDELISSSFTRMNPELAFQPQLIIEDLSGKNLISCGRRREKKKRETLPWTINYIMKENSCPGNRKKRNKIHIIRK